MTLDRTGIVERRTRDAFLSEAFGTLIWGAMRNRCLVLVAASLTLAAVSLAVEEAISFADHTITSSSFRPVAETSDTDIPQELLRLKGADPAADVAEAIKKHDFRFLEVAGFSVDTPGLPKGPKRGWLVLRYGVRRIEGTTDNKMIPELQEAAQRYAERYNRLLLEHIERR